MKHKLWKRAASGTLALALAAGMLPANVTSLLTGGTGIVAYAAEYTTGSANAGSLHSGDILRKGVQITASGNLYISQDAGNRFNRCGGFILSYDAKVEKAEYRSGTKEGYYVTVSLYHGYLENANVSVDTENQTVTVNIAAVTVPASEYTVTYGKSAETAAAEFPTVSGEYYAFVTAKETSTVYSGTKQSEAFTVEGTEPDTTDYLKFTAEEDNSSVTFSYYQGTFQYSTDVAEWFEFTSGEVFALNEGDSVYFRGSGNNNIQLFNYDNHVSISGKAACSGNIMTLVDYENPDEAQMGANCFRYVFANCTGLTEAPKLPATALAEQCYYGMFYACTALTEAPALPATNLAYMCYYQMFNGCTGIRLAAAQDAAYQTAYRIPSVGEITTDVPENALEDMFANTGGTFTGTPGINTTYYMKKSGEPALTNLSDAVITLAENSAEITGVMLGETPLTEGTDYTLSYKQGETVLDDAPTAPGNYTAVITGTGIYTGTAEQEFTIPYSVAITNAVTVNNMPSKLRFTYQTDCNADGAFYGVLIYRGDAEAEITEETATKDLALQNPTDFFRYAHRRKTVTLRPYVELGGVRTYGEQVAYTYDQVNSDEGYAEITGAVVYNPATSKLEFTYEAFYLGEGTVTYGVLIKRGLDDGVKLTRKLAGQDKVLSDADATFRVADKGTGVTLRPYIEVDGVRKYGTQVTFKLSEMLAVM